MRLKGFWRSTPARIGIALLATTVLVLGVASLGSGPDPVEWFSQLAAEPSVSGIGGDPADAGATDNGVRLVASDPAASDTNRGEPAPDGSPSGDPSSPVTPVDPPASGNQDTASSVKAVRILWWNDTRARAPGGFEVAIGAARWSPSDTAAVSESGTLLRIPVGVPLVLQVFPDGQSGKRIEVPVEVTTVMMSDSEEDAIHVQISDSDVRVLGTPVVEFDVSFERD